MSGIHRDDTDNWRIIDSHDTGCFQVVNAVLWAAGTEYCHCMHVGVAALYSWESVFLKAGIWWQLYK